MTSRSKSVITPQRARPVFLSTMMFSNTVVVGAVLIHLMDTGYWILDTGYWVLYGMYVPEEARAMVYVFFFGRVSHDKKRS